MEFVKTDYIVCPYCCYEDEDCHELIANKGTIKCYHCGFEFYYQSNIEITYNTRSDCVLNNEKHEFRLKRDDGFKEMAKIAKVEGFNIKENFFYYQCVKCNVIFIQ